MFTLRHFLARIAALGIIAVIYQSQFGETSPPIRHSAAKVTPVLTQLRPLKPAGEAAIRPTLDSRETPFE